MTGLYIFHTTSQGPFLKSTSHNFQVTCTSGSWGGLIFFWMPWIAVQNVLLLYRSFIVFFLFGPLKLPKGMPMHDCAHQTTDEMRSGITPSHPKSRVTNEIAEHSATCFVPKDCLWIPWNGSDWPLVSTSAHSNAVVHFAGFHSHNLLLSTWPSFT